MMKQHFGLLMRQARQAVGHTPESLARAVGCEQTLIEAVEMNIKAPPGRFMIAWSNEIRFPFEQMAFLYAKEQIKKMYIEAGLNWDAEKEHINVMGA